LFTIYKAGPPQYGVGLPRQSATALVTPKDRYKPTIANPESFENLSGVFMRYSFFDDYKSE
jgi:hypothetical protein